MSIQATLKGFNCRLVYHSNFTIKGYSFNGEYFPLRLKWDAVVPLRIKGVSRILKGKASDLYFTVDEKLEKYFKFRTNIVSVEEFIRAVEADRISRMLLRGSLASARGFAPGERFRTPSGPAVISIGRLFHAGDLVRGKISPTKVMLFNEVLGDMGVEVSGRNDESLFNFLRICCGQRPVDFKRVLNPIVGLNRLSRNEIVALGYFPA